MDTSTDPQTVERIVGSMGLQKLDQKQHIDTSEATRD